jgi:hypothetical protein
MARNVITRLEIHKGLVTQSTQLQLHHRDCINVSNADDVTTSYLQMRTRCYIADVRRVLQTFVNPRFDGVFRLLRG